MAKRKLIKKEYNIEQSPFFSKNTKVRASLKELEASDDSIVLAKKVYFKPDTYVKFIITDEVDIRLFNNVSGLAKTILHYILYFCLEYNDPTFRLKASDLKSILRIKDDSYIYKAINDLVDIRYIARTTTREVYWINHNKFYNGNDIKDKFLKQKT
jgi:hypothetical protein